MNVYDARGNGDGDTAPMLTGDHENRVTDYTCIAVERKEMNERSIPDDNGLSLCEDEPWTEWTGRDRQPDCCYFTQQRVGEYEYGGVASTLMARDYKSASDLVVDNRRRKYIVRRLTPLECCRLQGFPDCWLDGVDGSDSAKYKLWGNGIALPCAADVIGRIAKELNGADEN